MSLYERMGGAQAVDRAVDLFYRKVLADERIAPFFSQVNMQSQARRQKAFLTMVFGGPVEYSGRQMREAHARLKLDESHFTAVTTHLRATLSELGVAEADIAEVVKIAQSHKSDVLNR
ncbi:group I truncated hemoglobin [Aestuariirhabdus litorea]|uniref:Group 1 truncated hemoglobin n=1 Tax=Aestuariirhabdus litorea TaxID=2528527 RepID=A0A3P3VMJ1_9GAMM|nr:group 1 truncated hemoglobin [Aestuariirhabdus litorea]RRJ83098.1 group 1 truncated hemoglobin [Aestuariirhabdus litorea]RWW93255.1 group 1 truncated hemoglobin [Endozoicomonadaceae bacterium GTF-13]